MNEEVAAVVLNFAPFGVEYTWGGTGLARAESELRETDSNAYRHIVDYHDDYGAAVEYQTLESDVGQYGWGTEYEILPILNDHVIEQSEVDAEVAERLAESWVTHLVDVVGDAQEATTLSAKEFATLVMMNNSSCNENRAADALSITKGTYRGKKGRIREKRSECEESAIFDRITQIPERARHRGRTLGEYMERADIVTPSDIYAEQTSQEKKGGRDLYREDVRERDHDTYEQANWRTAHIEGVDQLFVADYGDVDEDDVIRLDFDGIGSGGADMHRVGENIQTSLWIGQPQATKLFRQLAEALQDSLTFEEETVSSEEELTEWVGKHATAGDKIQIIDSDARDSKSVAQAEYDV